MFDKQLIALSRLLLLVAGVSTVFFLKEFLIVKII